MPTVTLTTVPANAISHTSRAKGELLSYQMIVGIQVGGRLVRFQHPNYDVEVSRDAVESNERLEMPSLMAARLIRFAEACFVEPGVDYDGFDFSCYVFGMQATPAHASRGSLQIVTVRADTVEEMVYYVIGDADGKVISSFIGLRNHHALSVLGRRDTFGISKVDDLVRVYGGAMIGRIVSFAQ